MADNKQNQQQQQNQQRDKNKNKGGGGGRQNFFAYHWGLIVRYYGMLVREALVSAIFITPIWAYFYFKGITSMKVDTDFFTLFAITMALMVLQSAMFRKGG